MEEPYCDECGGSCDGVHSIKNATSSENKVERIVQLILQQPQDIQTQIFIRLKEIQQTSVVPSKLGF